jgi:hypothetical protein
MPTCSAESRWAECPLQAVVKLQASGGDDLPEDVLGALDRVAEKWEWQSKIKFAVLICDAPGHTRDLHDLPHDRYMASHPRGLTTQAVMGKLRDKDIELILCHIGTSTEKMEKVFRRFYNEGDRKRTMTSVQLGEATDESFPSNHFVFCLDESASMSGQPWQDVMQAYRGHLARRRIDQGVTDIVSVITFDSSPRLAVDRAPLPSAPVIVPFNGGGGKEFSGALQQALRQFQQTASTHKSVLIFMSDGQAGDASPVCRQLQSSVPGIQAHFIGFGGGAASSFSVLQSMAASMSAESAPSSSAGPWRSTQAKYADIVRGCQVTEKLMQVVGKRISEEGLEGLHYSTLQLARFSKIESSVDSYDDFQLPSVRATRPRARARVCVRACMFRYVRRRACACVLSLQACACACVYACGAVCLGIAACRRPYETLRRS